MSARQRQPGRPTLLNKNVEKWAKLMTIFDKLERKACLKKSCHKGPGSQLSSIQDKLLLYIFEMCKTSIIAN